MSRRIGQHTKAAAHSPVVQPAFGRRLRQLRERRRMSQRDMADGVVTPSYVSYLESGARIPTLDVVVQLAAKLHVEPSELLGSDAVALFGGDRTDRAADVREALRLPISAVDVTGSDEIAAIDSEFERAVASGDVVALARSGARLAAALRTTEDRERSQRVLEVTCDALAAVGLGAETGPLLLARAANARDSGHLESALELVEEAEKLHRAPGSEGSGDALRLHSVKLSVMSDLDRDERAILAQVDTLITTARLSGDGQAIGRAHWTAALACSRIDERDAALQHLEAAERSLNGSMSMTDWVRFSRAAAQVVLTSGADPQRAATYLEDATRVARRLHIPLESFVLLEAHLDLATGHAARALDRATALLEGEGAPVGHELQRVRWIIAEAAEQTGDPATAEEHLRAVVRDAEARGSYRSSLQALKHIDRMRRA